MDFPPFEHLLHYEKVHGARLNISFSNIRDFHLDGFRRNLPKDLDLNWTFRNGTPELRRLIAKRHRTSPKRVLVTTGATEANFLVNASLVHPRERVLVDVPIYSPLRDVPRGVGAKVVEIPRNCEDGWRLDLDRWRKTAGRRASLLVFANLNNPTSTALSSSDIRELADIAEECDGRCLFFYDIEPNSCRRFARPSLRFRVSPPKPRRKWSGTPKKRPSAMTVP